MIHTDLSHTCREVCNLRAHVQQLRREACGSVDFAGFFGDAVEKLAKRGIVLLLQFQRCYWLCEDAGKRAPIRISVPRTTPLYIDGLPVSVARIGLILGGMYT